MRRSSDPLSTTARRVPIVAPPFAEALRQVEERGLGFDRVEVERLRRYFERAGREPSDVELAGIAQSWSEHCSYKSSRPFLARAFARLRGASRVLGTGDAGVVALDRRTAYALRIESHNHPSAIEPYGGAATGIGGILRDVLAVGAKPIALADPLFFGRLDTPASAVPPGVKAPRYLFHEVVKGIRDYGNRVGVPTVSGSLAFDDRYLVNPLVNVACIGWLPRRRFRPNRAQRSGDALVLVGGLTGRDGIGGVAFASRAITDRSETESRGAVQLGNPIMKEPLIRATLEAIDRGGIVALKDLGGGGLATASGELVYSGGFGSEIQLDQVAVNDPGLEPWEVWISESQERMILEVPPRRLAAVEAIYERFDVPVRVVGRVVDGRQETVYWNGETVGHLDLAFRVDPPARRRPIRRRPRRTTRPRPTRAPVDLAATVRSLVLDVANRSREGVIREYDHEVQGRTWLRPLHGRIATPTHGDASVLGLGTSRPAGLAITTAAHPWVCRIDPYRGAIAVVEEAARNLACVGARPDAFTNCLNFGSPEDPAVLGDFAAVVRGLATGAEALGFVVPSGNVSFYNEGLGRAIPPTPVVVATGIVDRADDAVTAEFKQEGDRLYVLGRTPLEVGGSLWARQLGIDRGPIPRPDPRRLRRTIAALRTAGRRGLVRAAHDVSDGGLAVTLVEMAFGGALGFTVDLRRLSAESPTLAAVVEGGSRIVVEVAAEHARRFERTVAGVPWAPLGTVTAPGRAVWTSGQEASVTVDLDALYAEWRRGPGAANGP